MSNRFEAAQVNSVVNLSNDDLGGDDLVSRPGTGQYIYIERLVVSVYEAAEGGGGIVEILDTGGGVVWRVNADGVKDFALNFGEDGLRVGPDVGIIATVSGAQTKQASASVSLTGHIGFR